MSQGETTAKKTDSLSPKRPGSRPVARQKVGPLGSRCWPAPPVIPFAGLMTHVLGTVLMGSRSPAAPGGQQPGWVSNGSDSAHCSGKALGCCSGTRGFTLSESKMCVTRDPHTQGKGNMNTALRCGQRRGPKLWFLVLGLEGSGGLHLSPAPPRALSTVQGTPESKAGRETGHYETLRGSALYTTLRDLGTPTS